MSCQINLESESFRRLGLCVQRQFYCFLSVFLTFLKSPHLLLKCFVDHEETPWSPSAEFPSAFGE